MLSSWKNLIGLYWYVKKTSRPNGSRPNGAVFGSRPNGSRPNGKTPNWYAMRDRLAVETPEERKTRLQRMSTNQHERLAVGTPEEREVRLEHYSTRYREQQSVQPQFPLLQQCSIQAKMQKFHVNMATLDTPTCSTCSERFPGLHFHSTSNECLCGPPWGSYIHTDTTCIQHVNMGPAQDRPNNR